MGDKTLRSWAHPVGREVNAGTSFRIPPHPAVAVVPSPLIVKLPDADEELVGFGITQNLGHDFASLPAP
jgi:hypothetical protein